MIFYLGLLDCVIDHLDSLEIGWRVKVELHLTLELTNYVEQVRR